MDKPLTIQERKTLVALVKSARHGLEQALKLVGPQQEVRSAEEAKGDA